MKHVSKNISKYASILICGILLAACGGGGDSTPAAATKAEGVYSGTLSGSTSSAFELLILDNDEYWSIYGTNTASAFLVRGFIQGQGASSFGSFTSSNLKDFAAGATPASGSVNASYSVNTSINGNIIESAGTVGFSGAPIVNSTYNYNTTATVASISGSWSLTTLAGTPATLTVATTGAFTGASAGCTYSGSLTPRVTGKNVFNLALTFGAAPCALPGQAATGIALTYLLANGVTRQLVVAGVDASRTNGTALVGTR